MQPGRAFLGVTTSIALATAPLPAVAREGRLEIAVLDAKASGGVNPTSVEGLPSLIAAELGARLGAQVLSGSDLRAMISFQKYKDMLSCTDSGCLAEIGGALGVDYIVATEVSSVGGTWLLSISAVDIGKARPIGRIARTTKHESDLVEVALDGVAELTQVLQGGRATFVAQRQKKSVLPALGTLVLAAGAAVGGGLLLASSYSKRSEYIDGTGGDKLTEDPTLTRSQADQLAKDGQSQALLGVVLLGVAVLGGGATYLLWPRQPGPPPRENPAP